MVLLDLKKYHPFRFSTWVMAMRAIRDGLLFPRSQRETAERLTPSRPANSSWEVIPNTFSRILRISAGPYSFTSGIFFGGTKKPPEHMNTREKINFQE